MSITLAVIGGLGIGEILVFVAGPVLLLILIVCVLKKDARNRKVD